MSKRFKVSRGIKQGGCCSAYYFIILVETLARKLREANIEGIDINGISKLLGQYADDLDLYLWGSQENISKALQTVKKFELSSGMKINISKLTLLKLGACRKLDFRTGIQETNQINVLGVNILNENNSQKLLHANYEHLVVKAQGILNKWRNRGLSLLGKVMVINTLVASLFVYKMTVLPPISEIYVKKLNEMLNNFLWNGSRPKIKLEILQLPKWLGGAGLVNFTVKDLSLKFSWVKDIMSDSFIENNAYHFIHRTLREQIWKCNLSPLDVDVLKISDPFWKSVLIVWSTLNYVKHVLPDDFPSQCNWYNSHIKRQDKPFFFHAMWRKGLVSILQLFGNDGHIRTADSLVAEYGETVLQMNSILTALPKEWRKIIVPPEVVPCLYDSILEKKKIMAYAYRAVMQRHSAIGKCYNFWCNKINLELEDIENAFKNLYKFTNYMKLRSFQYRLLHNALVFNNQLLHWGLMASKNCTNCNKEIENVLHFFCKCETAVRLWSDIALFIKQKTGQDWCPNNKDIILGIANNKVSVSNLIIVATKSIMYTSRCKNETINLERIKNFISECERLEQFNAI